MITFPGQILVDQIAAAMLWVIRKRRESTFAWITQRLAEDGWPVEGEEVIQVHEHAHLVLWTRVSLEFAHAFTYLLSRKLIEVIPCHYVRYLADGEMPVLPVATDLNLRPVEDMWLPVVIRKKRKRR